MSEGYEDGLQHITSSIERVASSFSLVGSFIIIISFTCSTAFHRKPINRLIFYAAFGNVLSNVGTMIAAAYVSQPNSPGCQFQATLIQTFVPADAYWALAMAVNVWLTFYRKTDAVGLRRMEKWYFGLCYGCPLIPAIIMIFATHAQKGRIYGDAKLWCWITAERPILRFATFHGPVWVAIITTFFIYSKAGRDIYAKRRQLRDFGDISGCQAELLTVLDPFSTKTTEIVVTSEPAPRELPTNGPSWRRRLSFVGTAHTTDYPCSDEHNHQPERPAAYSVTISAKKTADRLDPASPLAVHSKDEIDSRGNHEHARAASVCTASLSSLHDSLPADVATTTTTEQRNYAATTRLQHNRAAIAANSAAWSYTKCAMLFFTASIITWLPSTSNRLYNVISGGESSPTLEYMSAFVLPMQGFWNCTIYCFTSRESVKLFLEEILCFFTCSRRLPSCSFSSTSSLTSPRLLRNSGGGGDGSRDQASSTGRTRCKQAEKRQNQYELEEQKQNHDQPDLAEGLQWEISPTPPSRIYRNAFRSKPGADRRASRSLARPFSLGSLAGSPKPGSADIVMSSTRNSTAELVPPSKEGLVSR